MGCTKTGFHFVPRLMGKNSNLAKAKVFQLTLMIHDISRLTHHAGTKEFPQKNTRTIVRPGFKKTTGTTTTIPPQNRFVGSNLSPTPFGDQIQVLASMKINIMFRCGFCQEAPHPQTATKKDTMNLGNLDKLSRWVIIPTCPAVKHVSTVILAYPRRQTPISGKVARQNDIFQVFLGQQTNQELVLTI